MIAYKTAESWATVPHVAFSYEPNVARLRLNLAKINHAGATHITFNTLLLNVIVDALKAAPKMNGGARVDISLPWLLPSGDMVTMNLRDFGAKSVGQMQMYINDLRRRIANTNINVPLYAVAVQNLLRELRRGRVIHVVKTLWATRFGRSRVRCPSKAERKAYRAIPNADKILPADLDVGSITVSNIGSLYKNLRGGVTLLDVIPPQRVALGIGAIQPNGTLPICIAFDHRVLNFNDIVPFIKRFDERADAVVN